MSTRNTPPPSTSFPKPLARYADSLEAALRAAVPEDNAPLHGAVRYHMGWNDQTGGSIAGAGGKRLRPVLCLMACEAVGGTVPVAMPAAVAVELVHNFSLVHDDVQDRDRERHQRPTVWALWGEPQAISVGNALYALACKSILDLAPNKVPTDLVVQALACLIKSSLDMLHGQYLDLEFERRLEVSTQEYLDMIAHKTGALIACAMELGCLVGSRDPGMVSLFSRSGMHIGKLFQLRDDVLGIWGDAAITGKTVYGDIQRKKKTFPVIHAFRHAKSASAAALQMVYRKERLDANDIELVLGVLDATGARLEAHRQATEFADKALETVSSATISLQSRRDLEGLVSFLLYRER